MLKLLVKGALFTATHSTSSCPFAYLQEPKMPKCMIE